MIPLSQGDRLGWDDPWIEFSFVLSVFTFVGFIWRELTAKHPMLDLTLFRKTTFAVSVGLRAAMGMGYYVPIFLLPLFTQDVMGWPPTISGLLLVPGGLATAFLMPVSGWLSDKIGSRVLVFAGMGLAAIGTFLFAHLDVDWTPNQIALDMMVRSAALGLLFTPLTTAALSVVPRNRTGSASGILNTVWQVAGSLGIALGQTYLTNRTAIHLSENAGGVTQARGVVEAALGTIGAFLGHNGIPSSAATTVLAQMSDRIANVQAYGDTFVFAAIVLALATPLALAATVVDARDALASERHIALDFETFQARVYGNPTEIERVIGNLLDNAIRYTHEGGRVALESVAERGGIALRVRDTGIGIKPEDAERIFERFWREDRVRGRESGTGLGLAIARALARRHGGDVTVRSAPGKGSEFTLWLPLRPPPPVLDRGSVARAT